jgi:acetyl esterase/lipase
VNAEAYIAGDESAMLLRNLLLIAVVLISFPAAAAEPEVLLLWPEGAPGAKGERPEDKPQVTVWPAPPEKAAGTAIVVCPGGGYGNLAMDHEGKQIAEWLNTLGVTAAVLEYRHRGKGYGHPAPMQDVQRAIRTVRANAEKWDVHPQRVGVLGFSAGGHLASTAATHFDRGNKKSDDPIERQSCRPDFAILCYPVIAFGESYTHTGSQRNLLGENADPKLIAEFSNEKQVTRDTPPTFLWHTTEDKAVPPENSVRFYLALRRAGVSAELHIFEHGRHGLGLAKDIPAVSLWPKLCEEWLRGREFLK